MSMCGAELWNRERLAAYMRHGITPNGMTLRCEGCPGLSDLIPCIEDQPPSPAGYELPELDPAPWYDSAAPESRDFAGFLALEVTLSRPVDRRLVQNVGHGATLTRTKFQGRTLHVRGMLIARTCCAAEYGLRWMTQALLGNFCSQCDGCDITFLTCCPSSGDTSECMVVCETDEETGAETCVPYFRETYPEPTEWDVGTSFVRQMFGTGLLDGPEVVACHGPRCGSCACATVTEIEFTIGIGNPWLYTMDEELGSSPLLGCLDDPGCTITFTDDESCDTSTLCPSAATCDDDPEAPAPVRPPPARVPVNDGGCIPISSGRTCFTVPAYRDWFEQVLIVEVYAGSLPLRNLIIRAWHNPAGLDCCDEDNAAAFGDCDACATLLVDYVPAWGTLLFDSVRREVTITCNNRELPAAKNISTIDGAAFEWIELGCQDSCVMIDADCNNVAVDATVTISTAGREL